MENMSHAEYVDSVRREAAALSSAALAGKVDVLEASLEVGRLLALAELPAADGRERLMSAICSELDSLPIGAVREQWAPDALQALEPELQKTRAWASPQVMPVFASLAQQFGA
jgi:hypothetical protein